MTVYPFVIHVGGFTVTGFGIMMMVAFLTAGWILSRELGREGLDADIAWDAVVAAVIGGLAGAKIYFALLVGRPDALFSRGGLVWYGGFAGGFLAVLAYLWWKRAPIPRIGDLAAAPLAAGYCLGRIGCFLVGDDYGRPTDVPWAVAFPQGAPPSTARMLREEFGVAIPADVPPEQIMAVHPTQLYEAALAFVVFLVLWRLARRSMPTGWLFGLWFILMAVERLIIEVFRAKDDRFFGALTLAQLISLLMLGVGALLVARARRPAAAGSSTSAST